jgi:hypothetical protein
VTRGRRGRRRDVIDDVVMRTLLPRDHRIALGTSDNGARLCEDEGSTGGERGGYGREARTATDYGGGEVKTVR